MPARPSSLRIRLQRFGRTHKPFYRIVTAFKQSPRDGKFVEILGTYNPIPDRYGDKYVSINVERIKYWIINGAQPTDTVRALLSTAEVLPPAPRRYLPHIIGENDVFPAARVSPEPDDGAPDTMEVDGDGEHGGGGGETVMEAVMGKTDYALAAQSA